MSNDNKKSRDQEVMARVQAAAEKAQAAQTMAHDPFLAMKYAAHVAANQGGRGLNEVELKSLRAMLDYTAARQGLAIKALEDILCSLHVVDDVKALPAESYDDVMRFLVDFATDHVRH